MCRLLLLATATPGLPTPSHKPHSGASSGFRFQLLRLLVQTHCAASADASDSSSSDGASDSDNESTASSHNSDISGNDNDDGATPLDSRPGLAAVLRHAPHLPSIARAVLHVPTAAADPAQSAVSYELLRLLTAVVDELLAVASSDKQLDALLWMQHTGVDAFVSNVLELLVRAVDYAAQPTYVSHAVVVLLHRLLLLQRATQRTCDWLRLFVRIVTPAHSTTAPTSVALDLLASFARESSSATAAQVAFVSPRSAFPFLQTWLAFVSTMALTLVEHQRCCEALCDPLLQALAAHMDRCVPDRAVLLAVLSEQDDVMVDVLNTLLQLSLVLETASSDTKSAATCECVVPGNNNTTHSSSGSSSNTAVQTTLTQFASEQLDPDLLFADVLETLGNDHLVLLDLLISSETAMLEYLLRYVRRLETNWSASYVILSRPKAHGKAQSRLDDVLAVLIRLRLEIDKQVARATFPYNPAPLVRRLERIEALYDALGDAHAYTSPSSSPLPSQ